jgi:2-polyprenyl-3-methyl-5-hydroxy-6-metoxy-1,4-benzoquinol methylase
MGLLNKLGLAIGAQTSRASSAALPGERNAHKSNGASLAVGANRPPELQETSRLSNGLKEFLWNLDGLGRGTLLDLGPAWQTTLTFFIERGFRVTSDDILRDWSQFLAEADAKAKENPTPESYAERTPEARAKRFLEENLQYPASSFDALLLWDVLDYLEPSLAKLMISQLTDLLRPGGVVFAMFHSKKPAGFQRYRVADTSTLQVLSAKPIFPAQKVYQNREIQELFGRFRSMKTFVSRDQLRETLFIK